MQAGVVAIPEAIAANSTRRRAAAGLQAASFSYTVPMQAVLNIPIYAVVLVLGS